VDQKAQNVASAFQVPERFPLWARLTSRLARVFSSLLARWPIGVDHDGNHLSSQNDNRLSDQDEDRLSGHDGNHLSSQDEIRLSERNGTRHSRLDRESPAAVLASARHILLVDDTFTTGATLYACYAALRPYTTARISIATLAAVEGSPSSGP
jgi:pyrimidine operon attenuation protein/uracil phosphoribosyltransferase